MPLPRIAISAAFAGVLAAGLAVLPLSAAQAQYYYPPPCSPFPFSPHPLSPRPPRLRGPRRPR